MDVTEKRLLFLSRVITIVVGAIGFIIAISSENLIYELVSYAWAGLGSSFGPALLLILFWKKVTSQGVIAGMLTGSISTIIWSNIDALENIISVRFVSFVFAITAIFIVSKITYRK